MPDEQSPVAGLIAYVEYGGRIFGLLAYCTRATFSGYRPTFESAFASFGPVGDRAAINVQPRRLKIVRADRNESLDAFARRHRNTAELAQLELINQIEPGGRVERGRSYKVVTGQPAR